MLRQSKIVHYFPAIVDYSLGDRYKTHTWRKKVLERDRNRCQQCFNSIRDVHRKRKPRLEVHHIIPRRHGGRNTLRNGITLCTFCHLYFGKLYERYGLQYLDIIVRTPIEERLRDVRALLKRQYIRSLLNITERL